MAVNTAWPDDPTFEEAQASRPIPTGAEGFPETDRSPDDDPATLAKKNAQRLRAAMTEGKDVSMDDWLKPATEGGTKEFYEQSPVNRGMQQIGQLISNPKAIYEGAKGLVSHAWQGGKDFVQSITDNPAGDPVQGIVQSLPEHAAGALTGVGDLAEGGVKLLGDVGDVLTNPTLGPQIESAREFLEAKADTAKDKWIEEKRANMPNPHAFDVGRNVTAGLAPLIPGEAIEGLGALAETLGQKAGDAAVRIAPRIVTAPAAVAAKVAESPLGRAAVGTAAGAVTGGGHGALGGLFGELFGESPIVKKVVRNIVPPAVLNPIKTGITAATDGAKELDSLIAKRRLGETLAERVQTVAPYRITDLQNTLDEMAKPGFKASEDFPSEQLLKLKLNGWKAMDWAANNLGGEGVERAVNRQMRQMAGFAANLAKDAAVPFGLMYGSTNSYDDDQLGKSIGAAGALALPLAAMTSRGFNEKISGNRLQDIGKDMEYSDKGLGEKAQAAYDDVSPDLQRRFDITRAVLRNATTDTGKPIEVYPLSSEEFAKYITQYSQAKVKTRQMAESLGHIGADGKIVMNIQKLGGKPMEDVIAETLRHEGSHAIDAIDETAGDKVREYLNKDFDKNPDVFESFKERYEKALGKPISKDAALNEVVAELGNYITAGKPLEAFDLNPTMREHLANATGYALDKLGFKSKAKPLESSSWGTPMVDKAIRQFSKNIQSFVDRMNKPPEGRLSPIEGPGAGTEGAAPESQATPKGGPETPMAHDDDRMAADIMERAYGADAQLVKIERKQTGNRSQQYPLQHSVVSDLYHVADNVGRDIAGGKIQLASDADAAFEQGLKNVGGEASKAFWQTLKPEEREAFVNKMFQLSFHKDVTGNLFNYFSLSPEDAARGAEAAKGTPDELLRKASGQEETDIGQSMANIGQAAASRKPLDSLGEVSIGKADENIRAQEGVGPKANIKPLSTEGGKLPEIADTKALAAEGVYGAPGTGLRPGWRRSGYEEVVGDDGKKFYQPINKPQKYKQGPSFGKEDMQMLDDAAKQVKAEGQDPAEFKKIVGAIQDAIESRNNVTVAYDSAASKLLQTPAATDRALAQELADAGLAPRETVEKNIIPTGFRTQMKGDPSFTLEGAEKEVKDLFASKRRKKYFATPDETMDALKDLVEQKKAGGPITGYDTKQIQHLIGLLPEMEHPRVYVVGYSPDKVNANAQNIVKALEDSDMFKEPKFRKMYDFLKNDEKTWQQAMWERNMNQAHGFRSDGQIFKGYQGEDSFLGIRDKDFKPYKLDDFTTQVLNLLDGGASKSYFPEMFQNAESARRPLEGLKEKGGNPLQNDLSDLGDKLKLVRGETTVEGLGNILESASETLRADRIKGIQGIQKLNITPSSYGQRATGFSPDRKPLED